MNNRELLYLLSGLAIGSGISYFLTKRHYEKVNAEEVEKVKLHYDEKYEQLLDSNEEKLIKETEEIMDDFEPDIDYKDVIHKLNYTKYSDEDKEVSEEPMTLANADPYTITDEDWEEENGYDKVFLSYFEDDEVLMVANTEEVLDNGIQIIGAKNLENFSVLSEEGLLHVRNDVLGTDYEIVLEEGSYANYISSELEE